MTQCTVFIDQLVVSPLNVRTCAEDAEATEALEISIFNRGLIFPLIVHTLTLAQAFELGVEPGTFGVLAGGRRCRAIRRLVDAGRLESDWPIPCVVRDDLDEAAIIELSTAENLLRRGLRDWEVHAAVFHAAEQGDSAEEIAEALGQTLDWVRRQLRLGGLDPAIFAAYVAGEVSADQAQAYAATEDKALQRAAFVHFAQRHPAERGASAIRVWLKVGDRDAARLLRFVGEDVYRAAGGTIEPDLFADGPGGPGEHGRIVDPGLLRELAQNKLADLKQRTRSACARSDLRFQDSPPQHAGDIDWSLELTPDDRQRRGQEAIDLPEGEVIATLTIGLDGEIVRRFWWASRKARKSAEKQDDPPRHGEGDQPQAGGGGPAVARDPAPPRAIRDDAGFTDTDRASPGSAQAARAAVKDEYGLTGDGLQALRSLRRLLLRALLVRDAEEGGTLARDYLTWAQLRQALNQAGGRAHVTGARGLASDWTAADDRPPDFTEQLLEESEAHGLWADAVARVARQDFVTLADPAQAFAAYHLAASGEKALAEAVLTGMALLRSANVPGWLIAAHDRLAQFAGGDDATLRELWRPTAAFVALFPKGKRLELAQPYADPTELRAWTKARDADLSRAVAAALSGDVAHSTAPRQDGEHWVHELLSFGDFPRPGEVRGSFSFADGSVEPVAFPAAADRRAAQPEEAANGR